VFPVEGSVESILIVGSSKHIPKQLTKSGPTYLDSQPQVSRASCSRLLGGQGVLGVDCRVGFPGFPFVLGFLGFGVQYCPATA
jgi:hypothetical protein